MDTGVSLADIAAVTDKNDGIWIPKMLAIVEPACYYNYSFIKQNYWICTNLSKEKFSQKNYKISNSKQRILLS